MSEGIKICHLTSAHPDGDVRIFHKECVSLAKAGYNVSLVLPNSSNRLEKGVQIISFESKYSSRKERMTKTVKEVLSHAIKVDADIYHLHDPELLKIVKRLKKRGKKVIYDAHEDLPRQILSKHWIPKPMRKIMSSFSEFYENKVAKKCDGIIAATPFIRDRFLAINKNTIDVNNYPILDELRMDFDYNLKTENSICYVGGITNTRGIKEVVKCLEETDCKLLLAGNFLEDNLKNQLMLYPGWKQVHEQGYLDRSGVKEIYKKSKLGLVTLHPTINYLDSLPVKMFEYMAAGIPVLASNFPLWKSIIEKYNCGKCVDPLNPDEISKAINSILADSKLAKEMGENGRRLVTERFNWGIEEKKLVDFYSKLSE
jgi:glycosyltransferase involved in cell wall biosynthesis